MLILYKDKKPNKLKALVNDIITMIFLFVYMAMGTWLLLDAMAKAVK